MESKHVQLEASIADSKEQASKELSDVKAELEQSQETATVKLTEQLDRVETRANFFFEIYQKTKLATAEFLQNCPSPWICVHSSKNGPLHYLAQFWKIVHT